MQDVLQEYRLLYRKKIVNRSFAKGTTAVPKVFILTRSLYIYIYILFRLRSSHVCGEILREEILPLF